MKVRGSCMLDNLRFLILLTTNLQSHDHKISNKFKTVKNINEICEINND